MTSNETVADLITRLSEAKEGSRELDGRIWCAVNGYEFVRVDPYWLHGRVGYNHGTVYYTHVQPHLTSSVDAILALIEKQLPKHPLDEPVGPWEWRVHGPNRSDAGMCRAALMWPQTTAGAHVRLLGPFYARTPALALCVALLTALQSLSGEGG